MTVTMETGDVEDARFDILRQMFLYIAPVNIFLSLFVVTQNTIIVRDFWRNRAQPATTMLMLIAALDIVSAISEIVRSSTALICTQHHTIFFPTFFTLLYVTVGFWSYNCSIFYNVMLSAMKAVNLALPFYGLSKGRIKSLVIFVSVLWAFLCITDVFYYAEEQMFLPSSFGCKEQWTILSDYDFIGNGIALRLFSRNMRSIVMKVMISVEYLIPCLVVLVCMVTQMVYIRKTLGSHEGKVQGEGSARHINITVFMVSSLYFVCNSAYGVFFLLELDSRSLQGVEVLVKYTLPTLNAAVYPIILISRKRELRERLLGTYEFAGCLTAGEVYQAALSEDEDSDCH